MMWFFFFKQKTAYEMRISDWSSDVCSSDLDVAQIGCGLEMPFAAAFRQFHAAPRIAFAKAGKQARYVAAFGHVERDLVARQRPFGGKEHRLDTANIGVRRQARPNIHAWTAAVSCNVHRPWRPSSTTPSSHEDQNSRAT